MHGERGIFAPAGIRIRHAHCCKTAFCAAVILALVAPHALGAADAQWAFELAVVGPDGKPIPNANVDFRTSPAPTAEQVIVGKFGKKANYGSLVTTDDNGLLKVNFTGSPSSSICSLLFQDRLFFLTFAWPSRSMLLFLGLLLF